LLAGAFAAPGCGTLGRKTAEPREPLPALAGTVAFVDAGRGFVLVDFGTMRPPGPGTALKCFSGSAETGVVVVGDQRRGVFLSADIVSGTPCVGDRAFR
jgi:hypothetical protein